MGTTVAELLELKLYRDHTRLLSEEGIENEVKFFAVMEAPDFHIETLTRDTFVLTTLSAHYQSLEQINRIITELCLVGVPAIGIKIGRFVDAIDPSTVAIARAHRVPLLTFTQDVKFREVLAESLGRISVNQNHIITQINTLNHELFDAILHNRSIRDLLELLCGKVECYCCCMDMDGNRMAEASSLTGELNVDEIRSAVADFYANWDATGVRSYLCEGNVMVFPCRAEQELLGILCIALPVNRSELTVPMAEVIVNALSVKFLEHDLRLRAKREMVTSVLDDLLFTSYKEEREIIERLNLLNFTPQKHYIMVAVKLAETEQVRRGISGTVNTLQRAFEQRFDSAVVFVHGNRYVALLGCRKERSSEAMRKIMEYSLETLRQSLRLQLTLGCSIPFTNLCSLSESYTQAKNAIEYGTAIHPEQSIYLYDDYFEMGLIAHGLNTPAGETFFQRVIQPIREYDRRYKSELWSTLEQCFAHSTLEKVSAELFIHISTLRYRLQKIHSLTGCNYFENKGRMTLYMAFLLYKVAQEN